MLVRRLGGGALLEILVPRWPLDRRELMDEATFNCPHCGALYGLTVRRWRTVESGSAQCRVCDSVMLQWSTASPPTFRLQETRGQGRASSLSAPASTVTCQEMQPNAVVRFIEQA